ncbi:MAG: ACP S-malonyltransferase, partial [Defluviitaleaceae bacterium]|nr:ACP S-malonyltransferase [Defluviitaleaceae bacterium]
IHKTEFSQPALLTCSMAIFRLLREAGIKPNALMGLSLGEYTALTAAGVYDFKSAVRLVRRRGEIMMRHSKRGGMMACMGIDAITLQEICRDSSRRGFVACANFNSPDQIVISGELSALQLCADKIKAAGGKTITLKVERAFHTQMMKEASKRFYEELEDMKIGRMKFPVISNVTGEFVGMSTVVENLIKHMYSPVLWTKCVEKAVKCGRTTFIEIGAGNALCKLVKKIHPEAKTFAIEKAGDLENLQKLTNFEKLNLDEMEETQELKGAKWL